MTRLMIRCILAGRPLFRRRAALAAHAALWTLALGLAAASPLRAELPKTPVRAVLVDAKTPEELRARLRARAASVGDDRDAAGEAWSFAGQSHDHSSEPDSAIACFRRASQSRGIDEDVLRLADALLKRRAEGDVAEARAVLEAGRSRAESGVVNLYDARLAWYEFLSGHADSAMRAFAPMEQRLGSLPAWRYRMGVALLEGGNPRRAYTMLEPLAVASRTEDREVMKVVKKIADVTLQAKRISEEIDKGILRRDRADAVVIEGLDGRGVRFKANDLFPLGGVMIPAPKTTRPRTAVVLVAPGDSLEPYDSLAVALRRAGLATVLLDVRGSGWSVAESCPLPDTWRGREERLQRLVARDVSAAARALAEAIPADTTRILLVAVGSNAAIAAQAATLDPRIQALVLVSPIVAPVELGPMRARLARTALPVFYQLGAEDYPNTEQNEILLHAADERASRVVENRSTPGGPAAFRRDPKTSARLVDWIKTSLAKPRKAAGARPTRPRPG